MKKYICILFSILMISMFSISAFALPNSVIQDDGWMFNQRTGNLYIYKDISDVPWENIKSQIKTVTYAYGVTTIGEFAFFNCENLRMVYFSSTIKSIQYYAFKNCIKLNNVYLPYGLERIDFSAFQGCTGLTNVFIPFTVQRIGDWAFAECTSLKYITIPNSVIYLGNYVFEDSGIWIIYYWGNKTQWDNIDKGYYHQSVTDRYVFWLKY